MHRRTVLANTGVLIATPLVGCLGTAPRGGSPDTRIDGVDQDPASDLPLVPSVSVVAAESTGGHPASIAVGWENDRQETLRFGEERSATFHLARSDDERARLLSEAYGTWDDVVSLDGCWYVSGAVGGAGDYRVRELEPGETHEVELGLYADSDDCFTTGSYRFRTSISAASSAEHPEDRPPEEWGFVLHVDEA